jgi:hypothetical protein
MRCVACHMVECGHSDIEYAGIVPARNNGKPSGRSREAGEGLHAPISGLKISIPNQSHERRDKGFY